MKHFINLKDIPAKDLRKIITDAKKRKSLRKKLSTLEVDKDAPLKGKLLIQMFEKSSLRTRLSFYLAIKQLGGGTLTLRSNELHLGQGGESIADTAKILSTYGDGFMLRTDSDKKVENFKKYLSIPVINGLSPSSHPTQVLSDVYTVEEIIKKPISKLNICWIGDSNNVLDSLIAASVKFSFKLSIGCPKKFEPGKEVRAWVKKNDKQIFIYNDAKKGNEKSKKYFNSACKLIGLFNLNKNDWDKFKNRFLAMLTKQIERQISELSCLKINPKVIVKGGIPFLDHGKIDGINANDMFVISSNQTQKTYDQLYEIPHY